MSAVRTTTRGLWANRGGSPGPRCDMRLSYVLAIAAIGALACASRATVPTTGRSLVEVALQRRNWERNGTDHTIDAEGRWIVTSVVLDRRKAIRRGTLSSQEWSELEAAVARADLPARRELYEQAPAGDLTWWGYELKVTTTSWSRTVRFHSRDVSVPAELVSLVELVKALTK